MSEDRLEFRGEQQFLGVAVDVEWFDAEPVAGQQQPAARAVPDREGEHAAQPLDQPLPFVLVKVDDHFGVALSAETMAAGLQPGAELLIVVDLAVKDDLDGAVFVADRLVAAGQVDD